MAWVALMTFSERGGGKASKTYPPFSGSPGNLETDPRCCHPFDQLTVTHRVRGLPWSVMPEINSSAKIMLLKH